MLSKKKLLSVGVVLVASTPAVFADVIISNIQLTSTTLSFDLNGTIEDPVGSEADNVLYVGEPGNGDWALGDLSDSDQASLSINGVDLVLGNPTITNHASFGDYVSIGINTGSTIVQGFAIGQTINGSFSFTGGNFDPSKISASDWIVSAGYETSNALTLPDVDTKIGGVPEPGSLALLFSGGLLVMRRRRSGRSDR